MHGKEHSMDMDQQQGIHHVGHLRNQGGLTIEVLVERKTGMLVVCGVPTHINKFNKQLTHTACDLWQAAMGFGAKAGTMHLHLDVAANCWSWVIECLTSAYQVNQGCFPNSLGSSNNVWIHSRAAIHLHLQPPKFEQKFPLVARTSSYDE